MVGSSRSRRNIGRTDVVYPSIETLRSGIKRVTFRALGQDIELRLEPAGDVIADDFTVVDGDNGEVNHLVDVQSLKRKLYRDPEMGAALYIDEDGPLIIIGMVNSQLRIEPDTSKEASENGRIAHRVIEVINDENYPFDTKMVPSALARSLKRAESIKIRSSVQNQSDVEYVFNIDYVFFADSNFINFVENKLNETVQTCICKMMKTLQQKFDSLELGIKVTLNGILKITNENQAELAPFLTSVIASPHPCQVDWFQLLGKFNDFIWRSTDELIVNADIVILITTRRLGEFHKNGKFHETVGGVAYTDKVCEKNFKTAIVREWRDPFDNAVAHESAHLLGCRDDPDDITCPRTGLYGFSHCCKTVLEKQIKNGRFDCLKFKISTSFY